jgi:hypothetical protein
MAVPSSWHGMVPSWSLSNRLKTSLDWALFLSIRAQPWLLASGPELVGHFSRSVLTALMRRKALRTPAGRRLVPGEAGPGARGAPEVDSAPGVDSAPEVDSAPGILAHTLSDIYVHPVSTLHCAFDHSRKTNKILVEYAHAQLLAPLMKVGNQLEDKTVLTDSPPILG